MGRLDLVATGRSERSNDQRPLDFAQYSIVQAGGWQIANRHHATIIERLGARDAEGAGRAMRDHIRQSGEHALGVLAESGIWKA